MKKLFILLFFIVGLFLLIITNTSWLAFGQKDNQLEITENIDLIEIDVTGVSTTIVPENRNSVSAEYKGKGKVTMNENGNSIKVQYKSKNWFNFLSFFNKNTLTIYIPEDYNQDIEIDSGSGSLSYSGLTNENKPMQLENLSLKMSSGRVDLSKLSPTHFELQGSSGHVEIDSLATKTGTFKMSSGNLDIKEYSGEVKAKISSGKLHLQMKKITDSVDLEVTSGFATLDLPSDGDFNLNGEIGSGSIQTDFPLKDSNEDKNNIEGIHGSGKHDVDLNVSSGKIEVK